MELLLLSVALMEGLDHAVLSLDIIFDLFKILRNFPKIFLLLPIHRLFRTFRRWKDVLNCVTGDKVLARLQALHWLLSDPGHWCLLVGAVVWEVSHSITRKIPGGKVSLPIVPVCFFKKDSGSGLRSPFTCPSVFVSPYSVCAWSPWAYSPARLAACVSMELQVV